MSYLGETTGFTPSFSRGTVTYLDNIDDDTIASNTTWSSEKIYAELSVFDERVSDIEGEMVDVKEAAEEAKEAAQTIEGKMDYPEEGGDPGQVLALGDTGETVWASVPTEPATTQELEEILI